MSIKKGIVSITPGTAIIAVSVIAYVVFMAQQWHSGALTPLALSLNILCVGIGYAIPLIAYHYYARDKKAEKELWEVIDAYKAELSAYEDLCSVYQLHITALTSQLAKRTKATYQPFSES